MRVIHCRQCGAPADPIARFCPQCGVGIADPKPPSNGWKIMLLLVSGVLAFIILSRWLWTERTVSSRTHAEIERHEEHSTPTRPELTSPRSMEPLVVPGPGDLIDSPHPLPAPTESPDAKPKDVQVEKPADAPLAKPAEAPLVKPEEAAVAKPTETPVEKPGESPVAKPGDAPVAKPAEAPLAKPEEGPKPTEAPLAKPEEVPSAKPPEAPVAKPADPLAGVARVGTTYRPTGGELASLVEHLVGQPIELRGRIEALDPPFAAKGRTVIRAEDGKCDVVFNWNDCPEELKRSFRLRSDNAGSYRPGMAVSVIGTVVQMEPGGAVLIRASGVR